MALLDEGSEQDARSACSCLTHLMKSKKQGQRREIAQLLVAIDSGLPAALKMLHGTAQAAADATLPLAGLMHALSPPQAY